jgi:hypothetical protein
MQTILSIRTTGTGLYEVTDDVVRFVRNSGRNAAHTRQVAAHVQG